MIRKRTAAWLIGILVLSVILNFAAAGFITASTIRNYAFQRLMPAAEEQLSPELREAFGAALRAERRDVVQALLALRQARQRQHAVLTAEKFDVAAMETAQADVRAAMDRLITVLQTVLTTAAQELPDESRRAIPQMRFGALASAGLMVTEDQE